MTEGRPPTLNEIIKRAVIDSLTRLDWDTAAAAAELIVSPRSVQYWLKKWRIDPPQKKKGPKRMRFQDSTLLARIRATHQCAWCRRRGSVHAAHLMSRGAGQVDIPGNVLPLCAEHHASNHDGNSPTTEELFRIAAMREGVDAEVIVETVHWFRKIAKGTVDFEPCLQELQDARVQAYARRCLVKAGRMAA